MIVDQLRKKLIEFQKAGDTEKVSVLRYFLSLVQNKQIELRAEGEEVTQEIVMKILQKQLKQRDEVIELYKKGNREDLIEKEEREKEILKELQSYVEGL